jgi:hypothetical protein
MAPDPGSGSASLLFARMLFKDRALIDDHQNSMLSGVLCAEPGSGAPMGLIPGQPNRRAGGESNRDCLRRLQVHHQGGALRAG